MSPLHPPRWAEALARFLAPDAYEDELLGDLQEGFAQMAQADPVQARSWYRRQVLRAITPSLRTRYHHYRARPRSLGAMDNIRQDIRTALRGFRKNPTFGVVSTLTLALAIGVNTAMFSLVSVIVFADLPMRDTDSAAVVRGVNPELGIDQGSMSVPDYLDLAERATSYEALAALTEDRWVLTGDDEPIRVRGMRVTANTMDVWRLPPVAGRGFLEGEDLPGGPPVAMLTHPFWMSRYAGQPDAIGSSVRLDGIEHTVVGVAHPDMGFADFARAQILVPLVLDRAGAERDQRLLFVTGRLAEGVTHERADAESTAIAMALADEYPATNRGWGFWSAPVVESMLGNEGNAILTMLGLTVTFVLLIACANLANMLLARSTARARELSVRTALGAERGRLVRQLLTESLLISLASGALGLAFAKALMEVLIRVSRGQEQFFLMAELDSRVLGFTLLVALIAPLVFGGFPALRASRAEAAGALRETRNAGGTRSGRKARNVLAGAQVALALSLMIVAGLLTRTVIELQGRALGVDPVGVTATTLDLPPSDYGDDAARVRFFQQVRESVQGIPGVASTALGSMLPRVSFGQLRGMEVQGRDLPADRGLPTVEVVTVSPGYLDLMRVPLVMGRELQDQDASDAPPVTMLSRSVARTHWETEAAALGARIRWSEDMPWTEVVGIVEDVGTLADNNGRPSDAVYLPYAQNPVTAMHVLARSSATTAELAGPLRAAVWSLDEDLPVDGVTGYEEALANAGASSIALVMLFGVFAVFALIMAAAGIYGVMSYSVSQRRAEMGLRMALGADAGGVRRMIVGQGLTLVAGGMLVGLPAALVLGRMMQGTLYQVSPADPLTFVSVPLILGVVALFAVWLPAMRATRAQPSEVLRSE